MEFKDLFSGENSATTIVNFLMKHTADCLDWSELVKYYDPLKHDIVTDVINRKDKVRSDGVIEKASRIYIALEQLLSSRYNEYTFSIPVKRIYGNIEDNQMRQEIAKAIESIYKVARINAVNLKRGLAYYASCQILTIWYAVKSKNNLYGFDSEYKLKCKTFSPMDGVIFYPYIDEMDDMLAMSMKYTKKVDDARIDYFETFTKDRHYVWKMGEAGWEEITATITSDGIEQSGEEIIIEKIPGSYLCRKFPVYYRLTELRKEIEYTLSRDSDVIAYNSAPVLKVTGDLVGEEPKGESRRMYRLKQGGDIAYVSWSQGNEATKYHIDTMLKLYFMQAQMPDVSFDNLKGLGSIGYDARQTLFTDAHLRIGEESGPIIEFLERECNVIKAFLKKMNVKWKKEIDNVTVEHVITPYIQNDEKYNIEMWMKANGDKPLIDHRESIRKAGISDDADRTYDELRNEEEETLENRLNDIMGGGTAI